MRIRRVNTQTEFDQQTDDYITQGYRILDRGELTTRLFKRKASVAGHMVVLILLGWWLLGIPNLIYHFAAGKDEVLIRLEGPVPGGL